MGELLVWLVAWSPVAVVGVGVFVDILTGSRHRGPAYAIAAGCAWWLLLSSLTGQPVWLRIVLAVNALTCFVVARRRPPSDRGKRLAEKLRGYKGRALLARLGVRTAS